MTPTCSGRTRTIPSGSRRAFWAKNGHLSNQSGAQAAVCLAKSGTRHLLLGHLSSENNTPDLAYRTTHAALTDAAHRWGRRDASCGGALPRKLSLHHGIGGRARCI